MTYFNVSMIAGIVFVCIFFITTVAFIVLCIKQQQAKKTRQIRHAPVPATVMPGHYASQPGSHPLPAGYAYNYNPAYFNSSGPPAYARPMAPPFAYTTPTAPPPAYSYSDPTPKNGQTGSGGENPFGAAVQSASSQSQGQGQGQNQGQGR